MIEKGYSVIDWDLDAVLEVKLEKEEDLNSLLTDYKCIKEEVDYLHDGISFKLEDLLRLRKKIVLSVIQCEDDYYDLYCASLLFSYSIEQQRKKIYQSYNDCETLARLTRSDLR